MFCKKEFKIYKEVYRIESDVYNSPISIKDLHEFLMVEEQSPFLETYELRAVYA